MRRRVVVRAVEGAPHEHPLGRRQQQVAHRGVQRAVGDVEQAVPFRTGEQPGPQAGIGVGVHGRFAEEVHNIWLWYTPWTVAMASDVHGVPGEGPTSADPFPGLAVGNLAMYMWVEQ